MCQSYLLLFVYQSQSPLNGELQTALESVFPCLPALIFWVWMHAVVVLFVWERSNRVSSRGSWLYNVLPQTWTLCSCRAHFEECVRVCGLCDSCPAVAEGLIWFNLRSLFPFEWELCAGSSSEEVDVVGIIVDELSTHLNLLHMKCIAYCILDRSFSLPSLY